MSDMIISRHEFYYDTSEPVSIASLAESLLGLEGVVKAGVKASCKQIGIQPTQTELLIDSVTIASYKDSIIVRLLVGDEKEVEAAIEEFRVKTGLNKLSKNLVIGSMITAVLGFAAFKIWKADPANATIVTDSNNTTNIEFNNCFNSVGSKLNMSGDEIQKVIETSLSKTEKESLKKDAIKVLKPDGKNASGTVTIDGVEEFKISKTIVDVVPTEYQKPEVEDPWEPKNDVDIVIRALDLDKTESGWRAIIPEISKSGIKLTLGEGIEAKTLPSGVSFKGDVIVIYRKTKTGQTPKEYQLLEKK